MNHNIQELKNELLENVQQYYKLDSRNRENNNLKTEILKKTQQYLQEIQKNNEYYEDWSTALMITDCVMFIYSHDNTTPKNLSGEIIELLQNSLNNTEDPATTIDIPSEQHEQTKPKLARNIINGISFEPGNNQASNKLQALRDSFKDKKPIDNLNNIKQQIQRAQDNQLTHLFNKLNEYVATAEEQDNYIEDLSDIADITTKAIDKYQGYRQEQQNIQKNYREEHIQPTPISREDGYKYLDKLIEIFKVSLNQHGKDLELGEAGTDSFDKVYTLINKIQKIEKYQQTGKELNNILRDKAPDAHEIACHIQEFDQLQNTTGRPNLTRVNFDQIMKALNSVLDHKKNKTTQDYNFILILAHRCIEEKGGVGFNEGLSVDQAQQMMQFIQKYENNQNTNKEQLSKLKKLILNKLFDEVKKEMNKTQLGEYTNQYLDCLDQLQCYPSHVVIANLACTAAQQNPEYAKTQKVFKLFQDTLTQFGTTLDVNGSAQGEFDIVQQCIQHIKEIPQHKEEAEKLEKILKERTPTRHPEQAHKPIPQQIKQPNAQQPIPQKDTEQQQSIAKPLACGIAGAGAGAVVGGLLLQQADKLGAAQIGFAIAAAMSLGAATFLVAYKAITTCLSHASATQQGQQEQQV